MIGLSLSGGGSRAIAFHLGCLRAMNELGILKKVGIISTISGGSVIGAYYAYTPNKTFEQFEEDIHARLRKGFHREIAIELIKPWNLSRCLSNFVLTLIQEAASLLNKRQPRIRKYISRTDIFYNVLRRSMFPGIKLHSPRRNNIQVVIGACELRTGTAFRFGNQTSGGWRHGELLEKNIDTALAVTASAAYPILLPAIDRTWLFYKKGTGTTEHRVLLTDGGVYDNLGLQVLEPYRDPTVSLHKFPCEYLIVCNAGQGEESGKTMPVGFFRRVEQSFSVVHKKVQDSAMNRLHILKNSGAIKGFVLSFLGQQDDRMPSKPPNLVPREEVVGYPTDFAPMSEIWIEKLSKRGEQLTKELIAFYVPELTI